MKSFVNKVFVDDCFIRHWFQVQRNLESIDIHYFLLISIFTLNRTCDDFTRKRIFRLTCCLTRDFEPFFNGRQCDYEIHVASRLQRAQETINYHKPACIGEFCHPVRMPTRQTTICGHFSVSS